MPVVDIVAQQVNHFPSTCVGKLHIERDSNGRKAVDEVEHFQVVCGHHPFQFSFTRLVQDDLAKAQVVFHDEQNRVTGLNVVAVVAGFVDELANNVEVSVVNPFARDVEVIEEGI